MSNQNIHVLIAKIRMEQVQGYLKKQGWSEEEAQGRLNFEKRLEPEGEQCRIFLPADPKHPKFRSLLQNVLFSLSVVEQREPIEIASQIVEWKLATSDPLANPYVTQVSGASPIQSSRFVLRNSSTEVNTLRFAESEMLFPIQPGEEVIVVLNGAENPCIVEFSQSLLLHGVRLEGSNQPGNTIALGIPKLPTGPISTWLLDWVEGNLLTSEKHRTEIESAIKRFCFAVINEADQKLRSETLLRAVAVLVCGLVQQSEPSLAAKGRIIELVRLLIAPAELTFSFGGKQTEELWALSHNDDPDSPSGLFTWLQTRTLTLQSK